MSYNIEMLENKTVSLTENLHECKRSLENINETSKKPKGDSTISKKKQ